jgi:hypothetical protein
MFTTLKYNISRGKREAGKGWYKRQKKKEDGEEV